MGEYLTGLPMRYSRANKLKTHARIVKKASLRPREMGALVGGVSDLMQQAGLTHHAYYGQFHSREALLIESLP